MPYINAIRMAFRFYCNVRLLAGEIYLFSFQLLSVSQPLNFPKLLEQKCGFLNAIMRWIWMFPKIVVPPNHPFWGTPIFGNTYIPNIFRGFLRVWQVIWGVLSIEITTFICIGLTA